MTESASGVASPIVRLPSVDSTQIYAAGLAANGAPDGTAVGAETQTHGRGRRGREGHEAPGSCLLLSLILRSSLPPARLPLLSLARAVALAEAPIGVAGGGRRTEGAQRC